MNRDAILLEIRESLAQHIIDPRLISEAEPTIVVAASAIVSVLQFLRTNSRCQFTQLTDIAGVDYLGSLAFNPPHRFAVVYHLLSMKFKIRLRVKVFVDDLQPVRSVSSVFDAATWYEREIWDLYGIPFENQPDLRRILTDYGFDGHPLRKDFPLTGYVELRYDYEQKRVMYEPVKLQQDYRSFDFLSPWEGPALPPRAPGDPQ